MGTYDFSHSTAFPQSTGYGNANMFLGNFNSYSEGGRKIADALVFRPGGLRAG